jgi:ribosomal protein S18 acetylase RimI-like enzyme
MSISFKLTQASPAELAAAVEGNLFDLFRAMARLPGAELHEEARLCRHLSSPFDPMFKGVWQTRLAPEEVGTAIAESITYFQSRRAPFFFWWTGPETQPANLGERLEAHGLVAWDLDSPGMVAELSALDAGVLERTPSDFVIERVTTAAQLDQFKLAFVAGLEMPEWAGQAWVEATLAFGLDQAPWIIYLGLQNDEPVACSILFNGGGVASVYGVATIPSARRQGIGAAMTIIAFQAAQTMGYHYGVLFATDLSVSVYRRIGFQDCEVGISRYLWRNE